MFSTRPVTGTVLRVVIVLTTGAAFALLPHLPAATEPETRKRIQHSVMVLRDFGPKNALLAAGDINGDKHNDLVRVGTVSGRIEVAYGQGNLTFGKLQPLLERMGAGAVAVDCADIDDRRGDELIVLEGSGQVRVGYRLAGGGPRFRRWGRLQSRFTRPAILKVIGGINEPAGLLAGSADGTWETAHWKFMGRPEDWELPKLRHTVLGKLDPPPDAVYVDESAFCGFTTMVYQFNLTWTSRRTVHTNSLSPGNPWGKPRRIGEDDGRALARKMLWLDPIAHDRQLEPDFTPLPRDINGFRPADLNGDQIDDLYTVTPSGDVVAYPVGK